MRIVAIEANIGVGKSTLIPELAKALNFNAIQEPVDDPEFTRLLKDFTSFPNDTDKRLKFQMYITETRAALLKDLPDGDYIIERSLFSDLVFSQVNMLGMERPDGKYLAYYYDIIDRLKDYPRMDILVYLKCDPKVAHNRINERARDAESGTPLEYIEDLERYHAAALPQICRTYGTSLIELDWSMFGSAEHVASLITMELDKCGNSN